MASDAVVFGIGAVVGTIFLVMSALRTYAHWIIIGQLRELNLAKDFEGSAPLVPKEKEQKKPREAVYVSDHAPKKVMKKIVDEEELTYKREEIERLMDEYKAMQGL